MLGTDGFIIKNENDENENDTTLIQSNNEHNKNFPPPKNFKI